MKKGCSIIFVIMAILWLIGSLLPDDSPEAKESESDRAALHCKWCKELFVAKEIGGLKVWYKGDNGNCYIKEVYGGTHYDFCTLEHCELFPNDETKQPDSQIEDMFKKDGSDIADCPYKNIHHTIQYPYQCPGCSYVGKNP